MRRLAVAGLLLAGVAVLAQDQFLTGDALRDEVAKTCAEGCMVFSHKDIERLVSEFNKDLDARGQAEFKRGLLTCRNSI